MKCLIIYISAIEVLLTSFCLLFILDTRVYMTVAADLVISGIQEPVRFVIETKAKIFPPTERFWYFSKRTLYENFYLRLKEVIISKILFIYVFMQYFLQKIIAQY